MIRTLLIAAAFLILTVALIAVQPGTRPTQQASGFGLDFAPEVSRGETVLDGLAAANSALLTEQRDNQRVASAALTRLQTGPQTVPETRQIIIEQSGRLDSLTAGVLAGLGKDTAIPQPAEAEMRDITSGILSNITSITGRPVTPEKSPLRELVAQALREGQSDEYIDALLNEAALSGSVTVPAALVTSEGRVDTSVLLRSIVAKATGETVDFDSVGGEGVEVRVVQRADKSEKFRFYTVASGDSLGSIAIKFYGDFDRYTAIYEANRQILSSPDRIRRGQRLVIPTG